MTRKAKSGEKMVYRTILLSRSDLEKIQHIADESAGDITFNDVVRFIVSEVPADTRFGIVMEKINHV